MAEFLSRGKAYVAQGDRKLLSFGWFSNKNEEAAELFERGANQFKLAKAWKEAGDTYTKLAEVNLKLESQHDSASAWVEAAKAYQKCDEKKSVKCLQKAISLYTDMGRLGMAARQLREVAEILEKEESSKAECLLFYEQAADLFAADNSTAEANKCLLKIAQFSAEAENYPRAIDIYTQVAKTAADNNLLRFSAKGHLLHAALCSLVHAGPAPTRDRLERYKDIDVNFDGSRECVLMESLVDATEGADPEAFTAAVAEFDALTRLDGFKTAILLRAKRRLTEAAQGEEEDLT